MTAKNEYAKALFMLSEEEGKCESVLSDLRALAAAVAENPSYLDLLDTPALPKSDKLKLIDEAFSSLDADLVSLVKILCEGRMARLIPDIKREFEALYDSAFGIVRVEAISAYPMSESQLEALKKKLGGDSGKTVIISNTVNPEILGGVKLRYSGIQLDGSVKTRLDKIEASLKSVIV